jgi:hypothetical protein
LCGGLILDTSTEKYALKSTENDSRGLHAPKGNRIKAGGPGSEPPACRILEGVPGRLPQCGGQGDVVLRSFRGRDEEKV